MRSFASLNAFVAHLSAIAREIPHAEHVGLDRAGALIEKEAKALIGTEYSGWAPLAESTVAEKERLGFTGRVSATDPLLREGTMRDSISHAVAGRMAAVGSDDPVAIYQETGTSRIPPRPFLATAAAREGEHAANIIGHAVGNVIAGLLPERG